jgi:hypothetical protein
MRETFGLISLSKVCHLLLREDRISIFQRILSLFHPPVFNLNIDNCRFSIIKKKWQLGKVSWNEISTIWKNERIFEERRNRNERAEQQQTESVIHRPSTILIILLNESSNKIEWLMKMSFCRSMFFIVVSFLSFLSINRNTYIIAWLVSQWHIQYIVDASYLIYTVVDVMRKEGKKRYSSGCDLSLFFLRYYCLSVSSVE